jgi:phosphate transport system substrate-binding protein
MTMCKVLVAGVFVVSASWVYGADEAVQVDPKLAKYKPSSGVSGTLNSIGSDTLNNLMTLWAEGFQKAYPGVKIQIEGKGSATAPPALIAGTAQIGPMSRSMKDAEIDAFEKKYGYKPTEIAVAIDALAVYVNKDNPVGKLTMQEVDAIFSKTRRGGHALDIVTWDQVGLKGNWIGKPISLYGRNSASGTYGYFKEHALFKGDYKDTVKEQPGSASVVLGVTEDLYGIGYSGIGYKTSGVVAVDLAAKPGSPYCPANLEGVMSGKYPLSRFLYLYVNKAPNKPLDPLLHQFIVYVLSFEGQEVVVKDGYLPLTQKLAASSLAKITPAASASAK